MRKLIIILLLCAVPVLAGPLVLRTAFFRLPAYSAGFDCDDAALLMVDRLQEAGMTAAPVLGNLEITGEGYAESDHIWVLAEVAGIEIALDRGVCRFDRQHYEGFVISRRQLLEFVAQDLEQPGGLPGNQASR